MKLSSTGRAKPSAGDTLGDGWKWKYGLDPWVWLDPDADPDADGLSNMQEFLHGTDPFNPDTDSDGLSDGEEIGYYTIGTGFVPFDMTYATDLLAGQNPPFAKDFYGNYYDYGFGHIGNPAYSVYFSGAWRHRYYVELNGVIFIETSPGQSIPASSSSYNSGKNMGGAYVSDDHTVIAALWTNLLGVRNTPPFPQTQILVARGPLYQVIEYRNIYSLMGTSSGSYTFQIVIHRSNPNTVTVGYVSRSDPMMSWMSGHKGAQNKRTGCKLAVPVTYPYPITDGTYITYRIGTGTNPLNWDTDSDGLADGAEVKIWGSDPRKYSSGNDFLPDGWKAQHNIHPTNTVAHLPAAGGMTHFDKYRYACNPNVADTDGDGVPDHIEMPHSPGSCPNDPDDNGNPANCVTFSLTVGDPSASNTERWELRVVDAATGKPVINHCDLGFGTPGTADYALVQGKAYTFSLLHTGSVLPVWDDYDYCALVNGSDAPGLRQGLYGTGPFFVEDPGELLTPLTHGHDGDPTLGKTGKLHIPGIGFRTNGVFRAERLVVAKWEDAIENSLQGSAQFKAGDFFNSDADRLQVFLYDPRRTEATLGVTVSQAGGITGNRTVTLHRQQDGTYLSTNLLLVADIEDRGLDGIYNAPPDSTARTFTMALEDTLTASYTYNGISLSSTASVGIDIRTFNVDVAVMTTNGVPCATQKQVEDDMKAMRERFAQVGIKLNWTRKPDFPAPQSIAADPTNWCLNTTQTIDTKRELTDEAKAIITAANLNAPIRIIYVPAPVTHYDLEKGITQTVLGYAVTRHGFHIGNTNFHETCFVTPSTISEYIPAHEVGHVFWLDHHDHPWNLMYKSIPSSHPSGRHPLSNKRLTQGELGITRIEMLDNPKLQ